MTETAHIAVVILAAGASSRMGEPKPFLSFGNATWIENLLHIYRKAGIRNRVVVLHYQLADVAYATILNRIREQASVIINDNPEKGRSYSIQLGLEECSEARACFIQNVDNPINPDQLLLNMAAVAEQDCYVVPVAGGQSGHPVLIGKEIISRLRSRDHALWILSGELKNFKKVQVTAADDSVLMNLNTKDEWMHYAADKQRNREIL